MACGLLHEPEDTASIEDSAWSCTGLTHAGLREVLGEIFAAPPAVDALIHEMGD